ncbi:MAG: hypothetical protein ACTSRG_07980 [Candidatus Helarchaeota archaeon]
MFHLIQKNFGISVPVNQIHRCHAYVKEKIEHLRIKSDYSDLEEFRIEADYNVETTIKQYHYEDAIKIQKRLFTIIIGEGDVSYEDDEEYFNKFKSK